MPVFSSTQTTTARSGGFRYSPTTSRTFSMNSGSSDNLKVSAAHGFSPNARQTRATVGWLMPVALAMSRVDQCVATFRLLRERLYDERLDGVVAELARHTRSRLVVQSVKSRDDK